VTNRLPRRQWGKSTVRLTGIMPARVANGSQSNPGARGGSGHVPVILVLLLGLESSGLIPDPVELRAVPGPSHSRFSREFNVRVPPVGGARSARLRVRILASPRELKSCAYGLAPRSGGSRSALAQAGAPWTAALLVRPRQARAVAPLIHHAPMPQPRRRLEAGRGFGGRHDPARGA